MNTQNIFYFFIFCSFQVAAKNRFDQSLFNRFYSNRMITNRENEEGVMMLNTQYRMAPSICEWPSKYFYGGKLVTAEGLIRNGPCYEYRFVFVNRFNCCDLHFFSSFRTI
jgi:hypothetical protein